ncbi:MAG: class I SAM-dependent methyltransferase [Myxococcota bacterium]|nr:class I SAM-dependent methyltransferase [Myxococcota bacterium]
MDSLFQQIAQWHGSRAWGRILDAGSGIHSLNWLCGLPYEEIVAVTGSTAQKKALLESVGGKERIRILHGNWANPSFLSGKRYDTVIADYLLGAIDGFAPYFQHGLFKRLNNTTIQRLYLIGLEPFPTATDEGGERIWEINRLRDACILLAGHRCYREYPQAWVLQRLEESGFRIVHSRSFPIRFGESYVHGQLDVCLRKIDRISDPVLARALRHRVEELRTASLPLAQAGIRFGSDYVIAAEPV